MARAFLVTTSEEKEKDTWFFSLEKKENKKKTTMERTKIKSELSATIYLLNKYRKKLIVRETFSLATLRHYYEETKCATCTIVRIVLEEQGLSDEQYNIVFTTSGVRIQFALYVLPKIVLKIVHDLQHIFTTVVFKDMRFVLDDFRFIVDGARSIARMRVKTFRPQWELALKPAKLKKWDMWADETTSISIRNNQNPIPHGSDIVTSDSTIWYTGMDSFFPMALYSKEGWNVKQTIEALQDIMSRDYNKVLKTDDDDEIGSIDTLVFNTRTKEVSLELTFD